MLARGVRLAVQLVLISALQVVPLLGAVGLDSALQKILAHKTLKDYQGALQLTEGVSHPAIVKERIILLALLGREREMLQVWSSYSQQQSDVQQERELLEEMAWGLIRNGSSSPARVVRATSLLAANMGEDSRGIQLLADAMRSPNVIVRGLAVELAKGKRDQKLCDQVENMLHSETNWQVRLAVLRAVGQMKITSAQAALESILRHPRTQAEEKAIAVEALINLKGKYERDQLETLVRSHRAGLRLLACQAALHCGKPDDAELLLLLLRDTNAQVRATTLQCLGGLCALGSPRVDLAKVARQYLQDKDPTVAISACWLLTILRPQEGGEQLRRWLDHPHQNVRLLASGAVSSAGQPGAEVVLDAFATHRDPLVRLNLALALVALRKQTEEACQVIADTLEKDHSGWMWSEQGIFRFVAPSKEQHRDGIPNYPEAVNQLVRLELLNALAVLESPRALPAIRCFLKERNWGISGLAAAVLLAEGTEDAPELVASLLDDPEPKVRTQAALVLGQLAREERAIHVLESAYLDGDRRTKEKVLETLGNIGSMKSAPFLIDRLSEPHQTLRILAAGALLQCLYH